MTEPLRQGRRVVRIVGDGLSLDDAQSAILALGAASGFDVEALRKATVRSGGEPPDPRFPALVTLVNAAKRNWAVWGNDLVKEIERLAAQGKLFPMTPSIEALLGELLRDHAVRFMTEFAGRDALHMASGPLPGVVTAPTVPAADASSTAIVSPTSSPQDVRRSLLGLAWQHGRKLDMMDPLVKAPELHTVAEVADHVLRPRLTEQDRASIDAAARRAAVYMRRPVDQALGEVSRVLVDHEVGIVRETVSRGMANQWGHREIARELRAAVAGNPTLTNNMDRVARTEIHHAHAQGALEALEAQTEQQGIDDPLVYKLVSDQACAQCRRIWGPMSAPNTYRLSYIKEREANGGNFRLPQSQWGPVVGPVHPNCTEGPLQYYDPSIHSAVMASVERLKKWRR